MKKIVIILTLLTLILSSCSAPAFTASDYDVNAVAKELSAALENAIVYQDNTPLELSSSLCDFYFDEEDFLEDISSYVFLTSSDEHVSEAGVFKVKSLDAINDVKDAILERQEALIQIHTNYDQNDLATAKNMVIGSFDDIVYFVATGANESLEALIKK